jgi:hypothetical protein
VTIRKARAEGRLRSQVRLATPDGSRRLSQGALVEASVRARLLGIPLLRLDATIALAPAVITAPTSVPSRARANASGRASAGAKTRSGAPGHGLAEAVRSINEGEKLLVESRRNGS